MKIEKAKEMYLTNRIQFDNLLESEIRSPRNISEIKPENMRLYLSEMQNMAKEFLADIERHNVYISARNSKMGEIPSVSLIPVVDCPNCKGCKLLCYDLRNDCCYSTVRITRANNSAILKADMERYFYEISKAMYGFRFFRWHIGGDIPNTEYFDHMCKVMRENKHCTSLVFTKNFETVNNYTKKIPKNLRVVFSGWKGMEMQNPNNFCTAHPIFADGTTSAPDGAMLCNHNCSACAMTNSRCFKAKKNTAIVFPAH